MKVTINGVEVEVSETVAAHLTAERASHKAVLDTANTALEREKARADSAEDRAKTAEAARADAVDPKRFQERVATRVSLERIATKVLGAGAALPADDLGVQKLVLAKLVPAIKLDGKSDVYVQARFDAEVERTSQDRATLDALSVAAREGYVPGPGAREDENDDPDAAARQRMVKGHEGACKPK